MTNQPISAPNWNDRDWFSSIDNAMMTPAIADWLFEQHSMTRRCEQYCREISVVPQFEGYVSGLLLEREASELTQDERYWVREIVLFGDTIPWISARTVIPQMTLTQSKLDITHLGNVPLGRYLFNRADLTRDYIQVSLLDGLWGRRSRLCLSGNPLLLTEIFLPAAPLYNQE